MNKTCNKCNQTKLLEDFSKKKDMRDGRHGSCKVCESKRKAKYRYTTEQARAYWLKNQFGISVDEYNTMFESQQGKCAICDDAPTKTRRLAVDHCHTDGKIRGLLCFRCNATLGKFNDDITLFQKAIEYLSVKKPT